MLSIFVKSTVHTTIIALKNIIDSAAAKGRQVAVLMFVNLWQLNSIEFIAS